MANEIKINLAKLDLWLLYNDKISKKDKAMFRAILEEYETHGKKNEILRQEIEETHRISQRLKKEEVKGVFREF